MREFITVNQYAQGCHEDVFGDTDACIVGQPYTKGTVLLVCGRKGALYIFSKW